MRDGAFTSWRLDDYCALFHGHPAPDEPIRSRRIDSIDVHGTVATATMTLRHGVDTFTDIFLLVHVDDRWRIANKAYHRHSPVDGVPTALPAERRSILAGISDGDEAGHAAADVPGVRDRVRIATRRGE
ncbi:nuclear transport factor 2 family protein [Micromonospora endolithica]|uniref:nuclear transport factor 2 family protein n=1 Tax=Micromonospora endolithica TaxID=230091 RepID=UPI003CC81178